MGIKPINPDGSAWTPHQWRSYNDGWSHAAFGYPQCDDSHDPKLFNLAGVEYRTMVEMAKKGAA
jgi:hypothetical protein